MTGSFDADDEEYEPGGGSRLAVAVPMALILIGALAASWVLGQVAWRPIAGHQSPFKLNTYAGLFPQMLALAPLAGGAGLLWAAYAVWTVVHRIQRPSGTQRPVMFGSLAVLFAVIAFLLAPDAARRADGAAAQKYETALIPKSQLGPSCDVTDDSQPHKPDVVHRRWALTDPNSGPKNCASLVGYRGWSQQWKTGAFATTSFQTLGLYGNYLAVQARASDGHAIALGVDAVDGRVLWSRACPNHKSTSSVSYPGEDGTLDQRIAGQRYAVLSCANVRLSLAVSTGRPLKLATE
jgi:hypothetical protein